MSNKKNATVVILKKNCGLGYKYFIVMSYENYTPFLIGG